MDGLGTCYLELGTCTSGWDYSAHPVLRPFGAGLRPFKIAPGDFVETRMPSHSHDSLQKTAFANPYLGGISKSRLSGGEGGIRTHERLLTFAGFQDRCIQPLCHLSKIVSVLTGPSWTLYKRLNLHLHIPDRCIQPLCHLSKSSQFLRVLHGPSTKGSTFTFISQTGAFNRSATSPKSSQFLRVLHGPSTKGSTFTFISQTGAFNRSATSPKSSQFLRVLHGPSTKGSTFTFISQTGAFNRSATSPNRLYF